MTRKPVFPTTLHSEAAGIIRDYFLATPFVDTVLVVNSCARGQAEAASDVDFAIVMQPETEPDEIREIEKNWQVYSEKEPTLLRYKQSHPFANVHLDLIDGIYTPGTMENGEPIDYFEIEIGNQIGHSAPMHEAGPYFKMLQNKWLPYYDENLRSQRLQMVKNACHYDLDHISLLLKRELYFHAFDTLCKAFQKFLMALFIDCKTYPIAYNKWIKEQVVNWLNKPDLYQQLSPVISVCHIESAQMNDNANRLRALINAL